MSRWKKRPADFEIRTRNKSEADGLTALAGLSRIGGGAHGLTQGLAQSSLANAVDDGASTASSAQLLCMSAAGDSIGSGGDYVAFDTILAQHAFATVAAAGSGWMHPVAGIYTLTYEHAWDSYQGGGTIDLELDGITSLARRIGTGTAWQTGRATIAYVAEVGQVGRIKVTHSDASAQTCDAAIWIAVPDPISDVTSNTAELYVGDELVAWTTDTLTANHTGAATVLIGEGNNASAVAGSYVYDDVALTHASTNLLGNGGFEAALAGSVTTDPPVSSTNWTVYDPGSSSAVIVGSPVHTGTGALDIDVVSGAGNAAYAYQDVTLPEGDAFEIEVWVYPTSGAQDIQILFDWNRTGSAAQSVLISWSASSLSAQVLGVDLSPTAAALPTGEWSKVRLVVPAQEVA